MKTRTPITQAEPLSTWRLLLAAVLLLVPLIALVWAFMFHPHLSANQQAIANFFVSLAAGSAGFAWSGVVLHATGKFAGMKVAIQASGGAALLLIFWVNPIFKEKGTNTKTEVVLRRVCGHPVAEGNGLLIVEAACAVEGKILGPLESGSRICLEITRNSEDSLPEVAEPACEPVQSGSWTVGRILIREIGASGPTNAEVSASLRVGDEEVEAETSPAVVSVVVPAPEIHIDAISRAAGFTIRGTADGLLDEEQVAVLVEESSGSHAAMYLYSERQGRHWLARDHADAAVSPSPIYKVAAFVGPRSGPLQPLRGLPQGFRALGEPQVLKVN